MVAAWIAAVAESPFVVAVSWLVVVVVALSAAARVIAS